MLTIFNVSYYDVKLCAFACVRVCVCVCRCSMKRASSLSGLASPDNNVRVTTSF